MSKRALSGFLLLALLATGTYLTHAAELPFPTPLPPLPARRSTPTPLQAAEVSGTGDVIFLEEDGLQQAAEALFGRDATEPPVGPLLLHLGGPVRAGQVIEIALPSNLSTGYSWAVESLDDDTLLLLNVETWQTWRGLGVPARQVVRLRAAETATAGFRLAYRRPWEAAAPRRSLSIQSVGLDLAELCAALSAPPPAALDLGGEERPGDQDPDRDTSTDSAQTLPAAYNWCDEHGGCPQVRDQGGCGSCWAFGTVGPLEAWIKHADGVGGIDLSEQYLVSCNESGWSCSGGWWAHAYHWNYAPAGEPEAGAVLESAFPYVGRDVPCGGPYSHPYHISSWSYVQGSGSVAPVEDIKQAIYDHGPVAAAVCAGDAFAAYSGGVFQADESAECGSGGVNHAIVLVGWDDAEQSWTLRNSWGSGWGEGGYMRIRWGTSNVGYAANYVEYTPAAPFSPTDWFYLPLLTRDHPPRLANGDFESGRDGAWDESSSNGWDLVLRSSDLPVPPHGGNWATWLGGGDNELSALSQRVTIPAGAATLDYWYWSNSTDVCGYDYAYVRFGSTNLRTYDLCTDNNTGGWTLQQIDVTGWRGQAVDLSFVAETDWYLYSSFFLDDVSFAP